MRVQLKHSITSKEVEFEVFRYFTLGCSLEFSWFLAVFPSQKVLVRIYSQGMFSKMPYRVNSLII